MKEQLEQIKANALTALEAAATPAALEELRVKLLGKKGELTAVLKQMGKLSAEERPVMGQLANSVRASIEQELEKRKADIHAAALEAKLASEAIDVTIPGKAVSIGHQHPMNQVLQTIKDIFVGLGYQVVDGPEVELADYNFTRLNIEEGHPSRDRSDTFYFTDDDSVLLRTQTSPMQIRYMEKHKPPLCMLAPGRVFRKDEADATHSPMFHQIEGLVVAEDITMGDLKGALTTIMRKIYGEDAVMRFRPHHFPFTEPSCEMDMPRRGLDRAAGCRYGTPQGSGELRHRPRKIFRLCLRHGSGAYGHGPHEDQRPETDFRQRHPVPEPVLRREKQ